MEEKLIDILWEVKEGKKHPNRAFKEICAFTNYSGNDFAIWGNLEGYNYGHKQHIKSGDRILAVGEFEFISNLFNTQYKKC